jgi:hypothetical protein
LVAEEEASGERGASPPVMRQRRLKIFSQWGWRPEEVEWMRGLTAMSFWRGMA